MTAPTRSGSDSPSLRPWVMFAVSLALIGAASAVDSWRSTTSGSPTCMIGTGAAPCGRWATGPCGSRSPSRSGSPIVAGRGVQRAAILAGAVTLAGVLDEVLKLLVRRDRPGVHDGAYAFRPWSDRPFDSSGFGMPSSHAIIAFAAAAALTELFPRRRSCGTDWQWAARSRGCSVAHIL